MCVDDESALQAVNKRILGSLGYKPAFYVNPRTALDAFRSSHESFDPAVIDYSMPEINGIESARELMNIRPRFPIVSVSGSVKGTVGERSIEAGVKILIRKPFTRLELARALYSRFTEE